MKILGLDAGVAPFSAALDCDGIVTSDRSDRNDALEAGLQRIAQLLDGRGMRLTDLDRIAVGIGPGSFTGIRIAVSFAKALAYGANIPLVGISSYDILVPQEFAAPSLSVVSGRPGVICARLAIGGSHTLACGPTADVFERLLRGWEPATLLTIFANTEDVFPELGEGSVNVQRAPSLAAGNAAVAVARLARCRDPRYSVHGVAPDYGEIPAVTVPKARTQIAP